MACLLLLWLLDDFGCYYLISSVKMAMTLAKMDASVKNGDDAMAPSISLASTRSSTLFRPICIVIHAVKLEMLYWVLQLDFNGFYDAGLVVK